MKSVDYLKKSLHQPFEKNNIHYIRLKASIFFEAYVLLNTGSCP